MNDQDLIEKFWQEYTDQFDLFGNEWHNKGLDEIFKAGFEAAKRLQSVVELPPKSNPQFADFYTNGYNDAIEACKVALTYAGIKLKVEE